MWLTSTGHLRGQHIVKATIDDVSGPAQHADPRGHRAISVGPVQRGPGGAHGQVNQPHVGLVHPSHNRTIHRVHVIETGRPFNEPTADVVEHRPHRHADEHAPRHPCPANAYPPPTYA